MPAPTTEQFTPEMQRMLLLVESTLYFLVKYDMTREEARDLQQRIARPLGILNARYGWRSNLDAKESLRAAGR